MERFDIVFTSYGVLHGLPGLQRWGEVIAHYLKPGGIFYIVEDHPFFRVFRPKPGDTFQAERTYFFPKSRRRLSPEARMRRRRKKGNRRSPMCGILAWEMC